MTSFSQKDRFSEEEFRSQFIQFLLTEKGYPKGLISKEIPLSFFQDAPASKRDRRADILVSYKKEETVEPLLVIECKNSLPKRVAYNQVLGYTLKSQSVYAALVWPMSFVLLSQGGVFLQGVVTDFPSYPQLLKNALVEKQAERAE